MEPAGPAALSRAVSAQDRGEGLGFGMPDLAAALADVDDELAEFRDDPSPSELGDVLFAVVQVARKLRVDPEVALQEAVNRFTARLDHVERACPGAIDASPERRLELWRAAKAQEG
ncbi:MazG nucleotide pyrophosphohydrolase domain-containing protein [Actinoplanes sp. NPDC049599]|uniref:MazG nucleotide pyrophosphohydrolase domain-containing protein n=1 Tax=Actinoplanes sp. NPDC049599 TaxID=3363903 RepID=UPI0037B4FBBA